MDGQILLFLARSSVFLSGQKGQIMTKTNLVEIKNEIARRGIQAEQVEIVKNGVQCIGFRIITGSNISPIVYYSQSDNLETFMAKLDDALCNSFDVDVSDLGNKEYVLENLYFSMQRSSSDDRIIKKRILNLEGYLRVRITMSNSGEAGSIKVTTGFLKTVGITEEEAWERAISNMRYAFEFKSLAETIGVQDSEYDTPFRVVTTKTRLNGSSALMYPDVFRDYCLENNMEAIVILPSSTQEVLILPDNDITYADFAKIVRDINNNEVEPALQLDPVVYRYDIKSNKISIVAEA